MKEIDIAKYTREPFSHFDRDWALLTSGTMDDFNSMTVSWGAMGTFWGRPVVFLVVKPTRYTFEFISRHDEINLSWFPKEYKKALKIYGCQSGRDINKEKETGLTAIKAPSGVTYSQADEIMICKKIFMQQLDKEHFPADALKWYPDGTKEQFAHYLIVAEVQKILSDRPEED